MVISTTKSFLNDIYGFLSQLLWFYRRRGNEGCQITSCNHPAINKDDICSIVPTEKGHFILGPIFDIIKAGGAVQLHNYIDRLHQKHGPIFQVRLDGKKNSVFVSSSELMKNVFVHEGKYPTHPLPDAWILYNRTYKCKRGLLFMDGEEWYHNRRILNRMLLNGNLNWMNSHIQYCTQRLMNKWSEIISSQMEGKDFVLKNIEQQLYRWSIDIIMSIMFGNEHFCNPDQEQSLDEFSSVVHKIFASSSVLMNIPPKIAKWLNLKSWREFKENVDEVLDKAYQIMDLYMSNKSTNSGDGLYWKLKEVELTDNMIKCIFVDLIIAAGDTTAYSSTWILYLLSKSSEIQQQIFQEADEEASDLGTPIIRGLVKEALRLYPVAPFIGRFMPKDFSLKGYPIKKDTLVLLSLFTSGRNEKHFPEPFSVRPERWFTKDSTGKLPGVHQPHGTLPFAVGNRSCIGRKLALAQMHCLVQKIVKTFHLECRNSNSLKPILRMVTVPDQPLQLAFEIRRQY